MTKDKRHYVPIHNDSITISEKNKRHLSHDELFLYVRLSFYNCLYDNLIYTNIDLLHKLLPYTFDNKETRNKKYIKDILLRLKELEYISFVDDDFKNSTPLIIEFPKVENGGYELVPFDKVKDKVNPYDLYVYLVCYRWRKKDCKMSYENWALHLGCSRPKAISLINDMVDRKIIYRNSGKYIDGGKKQETNLYNIEPFPDEEITQSIPIEQPKDDIKSIICPITGKKYTELEVIELINNSHWGKKKGDKFMSIKEKDYDVYRLCKDNNIQDQFIKKCEKTINTFAKNGIKVIEKYQENYDSLIKRKQEERDKEIMMEKINKTHDVIFIVDGKVVPFAEYQGGHIDKMYYDFGYVSVMDDFAYDVRSISNPSQQQICHYRPDKYGKWKNIYDCEPEDEVYVCPDSWEIA